MTSFAYKQWCITHEAVRLPDRPWCQLAETPYECEFVYRTIEL